MSAVTRLAPDRSLDIMIVDDCIEDIMAIRRQLRADFNAAYLVRETVSPREALNDCLLRPPDCLLLDIRMPELDGITFLTSVEKAATPFPIIVLTGCGEEEFAIRAMQLGAQDFLVKGQLSPELLHRSIRHARERFRISQELAASYARISALTASLLRAQEEERRKVSQHLHDEICQDLAALSIDMGGLSPALKKRGNAEVLFKDLQARVVRVAEKVRHISYQMHPSLLEDLGLMASLRELCKEFSGQTGIPVQFMEAPPRSLIPREVAYCLYRIAQHSLNNAARHANAAQVSIDLAWQHGELKLPSRITGLALTTPK